MSFHTTDIELGFSPMDDDHRCLSTMLDELLHHDWQASGPSIGTLLHDLSVEARAHFAREEGFMEAHFYPGLRNHRATHERLLVELDEIIGRIDQAGRRSIGNELTAALVAWFRNHVVTMDRELAGFLIRGH